MRHTFWMWTIALAWGTVGASVQAQWLNAGGAGDFYLDPLLTPGSVTVGDDPAATNEAALNVRADQLNTPPTTAIPGGGVWYELLHTTVPAGNNGRWRMFRGLGEMGRIYNTNPGQGFHIQAVQANDPDPGILWLENSDADGLMIRANGLQGNINTYPLSLDGFASLGVRSFGTNGMPSRARFQLVDHNAQTVVEPWRPYFRNGVLFTGNNDMAYIGHVYHDASNGTSPWNYTLDRSDLVISAGENDLTDALRQRIRFTYTTTPGAGGGAASYNGLEFMQLYPFSATEGRVGIGDFTVMNDAPTQQLDVRTGKVCIRALPTDPVSASTEFVTVNTSNGVLEHRPIASLPDNCEWTMNVASPNHVHTAYGAANAACPDANEFVGIGTQVPQFKLDVRHTRGSSGSIGGIQSLYNGSSTAANSAMNAAVSPENGTNMDFADAVSGTVSGISHSGTGTRGIVNLNYASANNSNSQVAGAYGNVNTSTGTYNSVYGTRGWLNGTGGTIASAFGSHGRITGNTTISNAYGTWGESQVGNGGTTANSYGAYGNSTWTGTGAITAQSIGFRAGSGPTGTPTSTPPPTSTGASISGRGGGTNTFGAQITADGLGVSTNATGLYVSATGGTNNLAAQIIGSGTFTGTWTQASDQNLKTNIADMPDDTYDRLMQTQTHTYGYDQEGNPAMNLPDGQHYGVLAQEFQELFPELVHLYSLPPTLNEDGTETAPGQEYLAVNYIEMIPILMHGIQRQHQMIAGLQAQVAECCAAGSVHRSSHAQSAAATYENDLRIVPNPVAERTELRYTVAQEGRVRLEITDAIGRIALTREEGLRTAGLFMYEWDTTLLAPGTYNCALYINDEFLVKKSVKLGTR